MALSYTSVDRCKAKVPAAVGSMTTLSSADFVVFLTDAEAVVNNKIAGLYTVPATGSSVPPLLTAISTDLGLYYVLAQRVFTGDKMKESAWPGVFKEAMGTLDAIANGSIKLTEADGTLVPARTDVFVPWSNNMDYTPTFNVDGDLDQVQDQDKLDDIEDDRYGG